MYELELKGGNLFKVFKDKNEKALIEYNGVSYDLESMINLLEEKKNSDYSVKEAEIEQFEQDPRMRKMADESEQDLAQGRVYSTKDVIDKIRSGEVNMFLKQQNLSKTFR